MLFGMVLGNNSAANNVLSVVDNSRLTRGYGTDFVRKFDLQLGSPGTLLLLPAPDEQPELL